MGIVPTLRQLYYRLLPAIPNTVRSYKNLGNALVDGRLCGLVDWDAVQDRTRGLRKLSSWSDAKSIVEACAQSFLMDKWKLQKYRPEVWYEKDTLTGVFAPVCDEYEVPYFSCRGYCSITELHIAAERLRRHIRNLQRPTIFYLGDHDPSGINMPHDICDRLKRFKIMPHQYDFERVALTHAQVKQYKLPSSPAKIKDSRAKDYIAQFGTDIWEVDAMHPKDLRDLVETSIMGIRDVKKWKLGIKEEEEHIATLQDIHDKWDDVLMVL